MAGYFQFFRTNPHSIVQVKNCYTLSKNSWERHQTRAVCFLPVYYQILNRSQKTFCDFL